MSEFASALESLLGHTVFISCPVMDFTSKADSEIVVKSQGTSMTIPLPSDVKALRELCGQLAFYFNQPNVVYIGWNIKNFLSYVLAKTGKAFELSTNLYDLRILENYLGIDSLPPKKFAEAKVRLASVVKHPNWPKLKMVNERIYNKLSLDIIPQMESLGVVSNKQKLHFYYEIAAQNNGRSKCSKPFKRSFNPHSMTYEEKQSFKPPVFDSVFVYLDYKHMEVSMLQWLSKDELLNKMLDKGDLYEAIWEELTGIASTPKYREISKSVFLPVVFGQGASALAERLSIKEAVAHKLVDKIYSKFSTALDWVKAQKGEDYYGRIREFSEDQSYLIRNFSIQSPAALFCLSKLVDLHSEIEEAELGMHIHDGYVLYCNETKRDMICKKAKNILESESSLFPGLKLKVSIQYGKSLGNMKDYNETYTQ